MIVKKKYKKVKKSRAMWSEMKEPKKLSAFLEPIYSHFMFMYTSWAFTEKEAVWE